MKDKLRKLGIWMDHSNANIMEFTGNPIETKTIASRFTHQQKEETLDRSEHVMNNKEQHEQSTYFKKIGEVIKQYDEVIIFGPTVAKSELHNILKDNHRFSKIKIETKTTDKMTENQQHAFVMKHFETV